MRRRPYHVVNFIIPLELEQKFKAKAPSHGDKSRILKKLLELFVDGKIKFKEETVIADSN